MMAEALTHAEPASGSPRPVVSVHPRYFRLPRPGLFSAVFSGEHSVQIESHRARCYPGLLAPAPDTRALYAAAAQLLVGAEHALDLGCGSGLGTAELCRAIDDVTASDCDLTAVQFARHYLPELRVLHEEPSSTPEREHDAVCVVDVLGQCPAPLQLLRRARRCLGGSGRLFLAELRAAPSQALLPPVRRGFSSAGLGALLGCAGFEIERWLPGAGPFLALVARPSSDAAWQRLESGDAARARGQLDAALEAYASVAPSAPRELRAEALMARAVLHAERGELDAASRCLLDAVALTPGHARALSGLAEVSLLVGERAQALELSIKALERDPCELAAVQGLARAAESLGQHDALATWRIANGLAPADLATAIELSRIAAERGELGYAIWVMERLRDFHDDLSADVHVTLSWLYLIAGRAGEARLEAQLARVKDPASSAVSELWAQLEA